MSVTKYSRQREAIKEYLAHTKEHPTADMVYMQIRKIYPNISLGTVYRNLNFLADKGEVQKSIVKMAVFALMEKRNLIIIFM